MLKGKKPWLSKTLWINLLAILALFIQWVFNIDLLSDGVQMTLLAAINLWLRHITAEPLEWTAGTAGACLAEAPGRRQIPPAPSNKEPAT